MTNVPFYNRLQVMSVRLIKDKGVQVKLIRYKVTGGDMATGKVVSEIEFEESILALITPVKYSGELSTRLENGTMAMEDKRTLIATTNGIVPRSTDHLFFDTTEWTIRGVETINPGGIDIIYKIGAVRD